MCERSKKMANLLIYSRFFARNRSYFIQISLFWKIFHEVISIKLISPSNFILNKPSNLVLNLASFPLLAQRFLNYCRNLVRKWSNLFKLHVNKNKIRITSTYRTHRTYCTYLSLFELSAIVVSLLKDTLDLYVNCTSFRTS